MSHRLDLETWPRRNLYRFFLDYERPFFNVCATVDVGPLLALCRRKELSFFLATHFLSGRAANALEPFRYRVREDGVLVHDRVNVGATLLVEDDRFAFVNFEWTGDTFAAFAAAAAPAMEGAKARTDRVEPTPGDDAVIHHSVWPWLSFTSISHARRDSRTDSVPKIVFGKHFPQEGRTLMPVSVEVHHALMDGRHVALYYETLQELFRRAPAELGVS